MKKNFLFSASAIVLLLGMNSCKTAVVEPDAPLVFSTQTVEQQKKNIEQSGLDLADKMTGLQQTPAFEALNYLSSGQLNAPALVAPLKQLRASLLRNDVNALQTFTNQMRVAANAGDEIWGTWIWNKSTEDFDKSFGSVNKAIYYFPTSAASSTNDGVVTITYTESNVKVPEVTPAEFYPKNLSVVFTIGGAEALKAEFAGEYQSDGTPTSVAQSLIIGAYNWTTSMTNKSTEVSASFSFNYNTQVMLKYEMGATGTFTANQIQTAMGEELSPEDVLTSGFMSFQVMNVAIYGGITDVKNLMAEGNALSSTDKTYSDQSVEILNKYLKFYGYFADPKEKFADVEFFTAEELGSDNSKPATLVYTVKTTSYSYYPPTISVKYDYYNSDYNYNQSTQESEVTYNFYAYPTKTFYNPQPRLIMSDGSKVSDFEKFANDNFITVFEKFESMLPNN